MDEDRYTVVINTKTGLLDVSETPFCDFDGVHYAIRRSMRKGGWGMIDFDYDVKGPDGVYADGGVSPHDGIGVYVGGGKGWGIDRIGEATYRLGKHTEVVIDKPTRIITVDTTEPAERIPHLICGIIILADPQERWEKAFRSAL